jgi:hypothetical protein
VLLSLGLLWSADNYVSDADFAALRAMTVHKGISPVMLFGIFNQLCKNHIGFKTVFRINHPSIGGEFQRAIVELNKNGKPFLLFLTFVYPTTGRPPRHGPTCSTKVNCHKFSNGVMLILSLKVSDNIPDLLIKTISSLLLTFSPSLPLPFSISPVFGLPSKVPSPTS